MSSSHFRCRRDVIYDMEVRIRGLRTPGLDNSRGENGRQPNRRSPCRPVAILGRDGHQATRDDGRTRRLQGITRPTVSPASRSANADRSKSGHESEKSRRGQRVRQPTSAQFKAPCLDMKFENPQDMISRFSNSCQFSNKMSSSHFRCRRDVIYDMEVRIRGLRTPGLDNSRGENGRTRIGV